MTQDTRTKATEISAAIAAHKVGDLSTAALAYESIITREPTNSVALHYLGVCKFQMGFREDGLRLMLEAVVQQPNRAEFHLNLAMSLQAIGRVDEAKQSFRNTIQLNKFAVEPRLGLARLLLHDKDPIAAVEALKPILRNNIKKPEFTRLFFACLRASQFFDDAERTLNSFTNFLDSAEIQRERALLRFEMRHWVDSASLLRAVLTNQDKDSHVRQCLAIAYQNSGQFEEALAQFDELISIDPENTAYLLGRANALRQLAKHQEATSTLREVIHLNPLSVEGWFSLGVSLRSLRSYKEAASCFDRVLALDPTHRSADRDAALALLADGDFTKGWQRFENRFGWFSDDIHFSPTITSFNASTPLGPLALIGEQGLGDEIMFGMLINAVNKILPVSRIVVDHRLVSIFQRAHSTIKVLAHDSLPTKVAEDVFYFGSIPKLLSEYGIGAPIATTGYLTADERLVSDLQKLIPTRTGPLIGFTWKTANHSDGETRNIPLPSLCETIRHQTATYVSLQYGCTSDEKRFLKSTFGGALLEETLVDVTNDLEGVLALLKCCDLVVTIGNTVAHLAGALGIPAVVILPYAPSWRWEQSAGTSRWYESLRLLKQETPNDWEQALVRVRRAVIECVGPPFPGARHKPPSQPATNHSLQATEQCLLAASRKAKTGDYVGAMSYVEKAVTINPKNEKIQQLYASLCFHTGNFDKAIEILDRIAQHRDRNKKTPRWTGIPFDGTLAVILEPNLGEEILLTGYLRSIVDLNQRAVVEVDGRLLKLMRRSFPNVTFTARGSQVIEDVFRQQHRPQLASSLEMIKSRKSNNPNHGIEPWLKCDPQLSAKFREGYKKQFPGKYLIGISWRSFKLSADGEYKSLRLSTIPKLLNSDQYAFISIQHGEFSADFADLEKHGITVPFVDDTVFPMHGLDRLAAQLCALDSVISVSNSTAHLSAALGVRTAVLVPDCLPPFWHWGNATQGNKFYSSATLIPIETGSDPFDLDSTLFIHLENEFRFRSS